MIDPFYKACLPEPVRVLGFNLRPLSLGHLILLHRIESPFVSNAEPEIADLASAVLICALSYQEAVDSIQDPQREVFMRKWADKLTGMDKWQVRFRFRKPTLINFPEEIMRFAAYIYEGSSGPKFAYTPSEFSPFECESAQVVKVTLMRDMGFSEAELLDRPWALCLWDVITLRSLDGQYKMYKEGGEYVNSIEDAKKAGEALYAELKAQGVVCRD